MRGLAKQVAGLLLGCGLLMPAFAQDGEGPVININGMKNPQMHSYRAVAAGLDAFDKLHQLAPSVPALRFHFRMRGAQAVPADAPMLRIAGNALSQYVDIDAAGRFSIPRLQQAIDEDASLIMNRKRNTFRIVPEVRSPGVPDNARRLGDLRLECQVMIAIAKYEVPFWVSATINSLLLTRDWCSAFKGDLLYDLASATPVSAATMVYGERRMALKIENGQYLVPLAEPGWPDDTLIELTFSPHG